MILILTHNRYLFFKRNGMVTVRDHAHWIGGVKLLVQREWQPTKK